ncbi:TPA: divalent-cation tolerance protein CutA [Providencia stuartii]|uniref:divalent-cation tolerance protein CutA n=1 Tax=Providencia stuartii TaxID=588 RepID=UPI0005380826|nr:divalent-cation tolerance protein CutA [Providencia stuartii]AXO20642.1 divalent-cation tolerance protein CutA [Providencia stuartii]MBN5590052.1 divalent-cation tolerance protein CutA [Providencia stuartii]HEM6907320.1 divalent-cation tolerance protein CutA [Providencia stuartii]HEM7154437.1 divalent-cation tolerance protein CutA [Providencia stuartii]HEM7522807.1 divalent-cation tolerance protein CutA [Providencia stuartii]
MIKHDVNCYKEHQPCIILCTTNSQNNAVKIAQQLLDRRLAACVSLLPEITSIYQWKNEIAQDKEVLLLIKSTNKNQAELFSAIKEIHPYETPELINLDLDQVDSGYLAWLVKSVK